MNIKRRNGRRKNWRSEWGDFFRAVVIPETLFFGALTLLLFLSLAEPPPSADVLWYHTIIRVLPLIFSGFTVKAFLRNHSPSAPSAEESMRIAIVEALEEEINDQKGTTRKEKATLLRFVRLLKNVK